MRESPRQAAQRSIRGRALAGGGAGRTRGATYASQFVLAHDIHYGHADPALRGTVDVSGVLAWALATPWRYAYIAIGLASVVVPVQLEDDFTSCGHLLALLIGFAGYPLTRGRSRYSPGEFVRTLVLRRIDGQASGQR